MPNHNLQSYSATSVMSNTHFGFCSYFILKANNKNRRCGRDPKFNSWRKTVLFSERDNYLQCSPEDGLIQSIEHFFNSLTNFTLFMKITQHLRKNKPGPKHSRSGKGLSHFIIM